VRGAVIFLSFFSNFLKKCFLTSMADPIQKLPLLGVGIIVAVLALIAWIKFKRNFS